MTQNEFFEYLEDPDKLETFLLMSTVRFPIGKKREFYKWTMSHKICDCYKDKRIIYGFDSCLLIEKDGVEVIMLHRPNSTHKSYWIDFFIKNYDNQKIKHKKCYDNLKSKKIPSD